MVGMKMFDTRKSFHRTPTHSMPNVNLIRHHNHPDEHFLRTEYSFNVFDYSYTPNRIPTNSDHLIDKLYRLESQRNSLTSQIQSLNQQLEYPILERNETMNHYTYNHQRDQQRQSVLHSFDFLNEINRFKIRLNTLEKERYELEDKVRRLQAENAAYKIRYNDQIGSRSTSTLNGHMIPSSAAENDIERLKRRIESLVQSNNEKERKIDDLQNQLTKYQDLTIPHLSTKKVDNVITQKTAYEADDDISDSNSIPSINSDRDLQVNIPKSSLSQTGHDSILNAHQNPLSKLKLDVLHRAASAEPMLIRELTTTPIYDPSMITRTLPFNERITHDQSGYISDGPSQKYSSYKTTFSTNLDKHKSSSAKGLKSIFGKIIRTSSGHFREDHEERTFSPFQRGGFRATITNGKSSLKPLSSLESTVARWQSDQIVNWLYSIGLGEYASECRKHYKNGLQLLHATPQELDKKMGMRNPIHRKKLQLCLNGLCHRQVESSHLDTHWVLKWLDDIGLPQYKEYFSESKVDSRILNNLTLEDIIYLNVTNELHHLCIKRSIQVLRLSNFNPNYIKRRPDVDAKNDINEIMYWSNHRVMEWLRSIDLSEYAPNLRGSGVCGALIVLELRFNVSILAEILSIPVSKTLLRRHLSMRFEELIGTDLQNRKNQYEKSPNCQPLTLHTKVKFSRGLFAHRRARSIDAENLICPMNENGLSPNLKLVLAHDSPTTVV